MRLTFRWQAADHLELILAARRGQQLWEQNRAAIFQAFYDQTGLKFRQYHISVRLVGSDESESGDGRYPMKLSKKSLVERRDEDFLALLTHELAHRLLSGHDLKSTAKDKRLFARVGHERIYLFLYDVWVQAFGKDWADRATTEEQKLSKNYAHYWHASMSLNYSERQAKLAKLRGHSDEPHLTKEGGAKPYRYV